MTTPPPSPSSSTTDEPDNLDESPTAAPVEPDNVDNRRKRRLIIGGVAAAAVLLVVAACGAAVVGVVRIADAADAGVRRAGACEALEVRLNRLAPPGSTSGPRERAVAIRNENEAIRPFLDELRGDDDDDRLARRWTELVNARTTYADALDRQARNGAPAFFVAPDRGGVQRLAGRHHDCAASIRRLSAPDL
ncbi:hypothetical protein GCM10009687_01280 [Asanoa iriomotensis]|uniref:hypothetical protein n=1 Tax=Asanoa iriomotensis TaxID=234613 RepID=UPI0031E2295A